jgi:hypothetical protein
MSDTFDAAAHAAATDAAVAAPETSAPQADPAAENEAVTAEDAATSEETTDAPPEDAHETPSRAAKRIQQLLAKQAEAQERIARLEGALMQQQRQQPQQHREAPKPAALPQDLAQWIGEEPKPDAFPAGEFDPQYLRAIARYEARTEQAQMVASQRAAQARQAQEAQAQSFAEAAKKIAESSPDVWETIGSLANRLPTMAANLLAEAGPEVAYAVGKDADAEARLRAARTPLAVAREIGRIEERLARPKETPPPQPTSAPEPPPRAVRGGNVGTRAPGEMSMGQYADWRSKQTW